MNTILGVVVLFLSQLAFLQGVAGQQTEAVCNSTFTWMDNSKGQNPCLVAAYLLGQCVGGQWDVVALPEDSHYLGPSKVGANPCQCSSVAYNVISACAVCQNGLINTWTDWSSNCTTTPVPLGKWTQPISSGTAIPGWAYLSPQTTNDTFSPSAAQAAINVPESTATVLQIPTGTTNSPGPVNSNTPPPKDGPNVDAIVGGVVGGFLSLGLLLLVALYCYKKKQLSSPPAAPFAKPMPPALPMHYSPHPDSPHYAKSIDSFGDAPVLRPLSIPGSNMSVGLAVAAVGKSTTPSRASFNTATAPPTPAAPAFRPINIHSAPAAFPSPAARPPPSGATSYPYPDSPESSAAPHSAAHAFPDSRYSRAPDV